MLDGVASPFAWVHSFILFYYFLSVLDAFSLCALSFAIFICGKRASYYCHIYCTIKTSLALVLLLLLLHDATHFSSTLSLSPFSISASFISCSSLSLSLEISTFFTFWFMPPTAIRKLALVNILVMVMKRKTAIKREEKRRARDAKTVKPHTCMAANKSCGFKIGSLPK